MKIYRTALLAALISLPQIAAAQTTPAAKTEPRESQKAFKFLKQFEGTWIAPVKIPGMDKAPEQIGDSMRATMRVLSRGNSISHEFHGANVPHDPSKYDHPLTVIYLNEGELTLTHYCDSSNRPRMVAGKISPDGKTVEFDFTDMVGTNKYGHMHHAVFTFIDKDHHIQEWTWMRPDNQPMKLHLELRREG
ncbi:MAG TPA: hypothetical protein VM100_12130 [Longimicrobiales bacterium]|nr:hypothetical protein [Longimicrobiales bacterium]